MATSDGLEIMPPAITPRIWLAGMAMRTLLNCVAREAVKHGESSTDLDALANISVKVADKVLKHLDD